MVRTSKKNRLAIIAHPSPDRAPPSMTPAQVAATAAFMKRKHVGTRFYHEPSMRDIGVHDEIVHLFAVTRAARFLSLSEPSYSALTSEFLATFSANLTTSIDVTYYSGSVSFSLGNELRSLTLDQVNTALNLRPYRASLHVSDDRLNSFRYKTTGREVFVVRSDGYAKYMVHPIFKII